ncbi:MAG: ethylbenzene dehydrogenase-related protein [Hydrogenothermaceae bacterium]
MKKLKITFLSILAVSSLSFAEDIINSKFVKSDIPLDPLNSIWKQAKEVEISLAGQAVTTPSDLKPSVEKIKVKSINNGSEIAFLLIWDDKTKDVYRVNNKFSDAVAVQIPYHADPSTPITMGEPGKGVLILHWQAFRQENIERGYADLPKIEPNYAVDWYPHAQSPYNYPEDWHNQYALNYIGGEKNYLKNTISSPVREIVAEGFGSTTWKSIQSAEGKGIYKDGKWYVEIKRRFFTGNTVNPEWGPGKVTYVTFAVWDGSNMERDSRKSLGYTWIKLNIEGK